MFFVENTKKTTGIYSMKTLMSLYGIDEIKAL